MKKAFMLLVAFVIMLCSVPVSAENGPAWNAENSIIVTVKTETDKSFTPEDFPEVDCVDVCFVSKQLTADGFTFKLILQLEDEDLMQAIEDVSENDAVIGARRNVFDYLGPILSLNRNSVTVRIGESVDLFKDVFDTYNNSGFYYGVLFTVDTQAVDISTADVNTFGFDFVPIMAEASMRDLYDAWSSGFDPENLFGDEFGVSPINKYYTVVSKDGVGGEDGYVIIEAVNAVLALDGITGAEPLGMEFPCPRMPADVWSISDSDIADLALSGGTAVGSPDNLIDQTATVTGIKTGKVTVKLSASENGQDVSDICEITVINSGDVNADGLLDNTDAAIVLKHDAGIIDLSAEAMAVGDMNGDGYVDNLDAVIILKYDAGLL